MYVENAVSLTSLMRESGRKESIVKSLIARIAHSRPGGRSFSGEVTKPSRGKIDFGPIAYDGHNPLNNMIFLQALREAFCEMTNEIREVSSYTWASTLLTRVNSCR